MIKNIFEDLNEFYMFKITVKDQVFLEQVVNKLKDCIAKSHGSTIGPQSYIEHEPEIQAKIDADIHVINNKNGYQVFAKRCFPLSLPVLKSKNNFERTGYMYEILSQNTDKIEVSMNIED